ncbi:MAG: alpha/beta fold hydrolase, partial [Lysobacterales bacterium]
LYDAGQARRGSRALTSGRWEVSSVQLDRDGSHFWFVGNRSHPTVYELHRLPVGGGDIETMTAQRGIESFVTGPDPDRVLVLHSEPWIPTQLGVLDAGNRQLRRLTDTRTPEYAALEWPALEIVGVPSSHQEQPLWSKLYLPADMEPGKRYPAVLFVHGAGYLQNTHWRFPQYYREQMFHTLLTQRGFVVLDIDYRASAGYGRDWRTAIYRQMGHPELEDLIDGIDWLETNHQVDPERIGVYGGSYGGFMALMSLFREPDRFLAGAALRPVTDWRHYNHGYTANILNTPELDPEAHRISSPIEYADGLQGHLLIAHGMLDDNVFYQDVVMLAQRLIELGKDNWELASYPLEAHGYVHPESWFDQYRRVLKLFERTLQP